MELMDSTGPTTRRVRTSPDGQPVTFVELFFDLVFVYAIAQTVGLLHHGASWSALGQVVLVFWLAWWAWTQFTWALNAANTEHAPIRFWVLVATVVTFFMALTLGDAFHGRGLAFALSYVAVRAIGLGLYAWVAWGDPRHRAAVTTFGVASALGLVAVLAGGALGGAAQYGLWGLAIVLDVAAALVAARSDAWRLRPGHFGERHGLFLILVLGESLIAAANGVRGDESWTTERLVLATIAVTTACALWWTYYARAQPALECGLHRRSGGAAARYARDAYSLAHFPTAVGVVLYSAGLEGAIVHAGEPIGRVGAALVGGGVALFLAGTAAALWRATGHAPRARLLACAAVAPAALLAESSPPAVALGVVLAAALCVALVEQLRSCEAVVERARRHASEAS